VLRVWLDRKNDFYLDIPADLTEASLDLGERELTLREFFLAKQARAR
jgi:hypothetical protein